MGTEGGIAPEEPGEEGDGVESGEALEATELESAAETIAGAES